MTSYRVDRLVIEYAHTETDARNDNTHEKTGLRWKKWPANSHFHFFISCDVFVRNKKPHFKLIWNKYSTPRYVLHRHLIRDTLQRRTADYHYDYVIMTTTASQMTSLTVVYSTVYSDADQRKHQRSAPLAFVWGIHRDRWIPRTKGQLRGKCFHLMTSSCPTRPDQRSIWWSKKSFFQKTSVMYFWYLINRAII